MAKLMVIEAPQGLNPERFPVQRVERQFRDGVQGVEEYAEKLANAMARNWGVNREDLTVSVTEVGS